MIVLSYENKKALRPFYHKKIMIENECETLWEVAYYCIIIKNILADQTYGTKKHGTRDYFIGRLLTKLLAKYLNVSDNIFKIVQSRFSKSVLTRH